MTDSPLSLPFEYPVRWAALKEVIDREGFSLEVMTELERRDRALEDFLADFMPDLVYTLPGPVTTGVSPRFYVRRNYRVNRWIVSTDTTGGTDTVVDVKVSGVTDATLTVPATTDVATDDTAVTLTKDVDYIQVDVTAAGTGAENLTVQGVLHR